MKTKKTKLYSVARVIALLAVVFGVSIYVLFVERYIGATIALIVLACASFVVLVPPMIGGDQ